MILKNYLVNGNLDIDTLVDDYYNYVYVVVKNSVSFALSDEDQEEIISDVFFALWKNYNNLSCEIEIKPYLFGIIKNVVKNKYRKSQINYSISEYEENLVSNVNLQEEIEYHEKDNIIQATLKNLKKEEYLVFIKFYYESKSIKEIAQILNCSNGKVKNILYRVRKILRKNLEDGGYGYGRYY